MDSGVHTGKVLGQPLYSPLAKLKEKTGSFSLRSLTYSSRTIFSLQALHLNLFQNTEIIKRGQL